jgi:putative addiction module component (TIGR02574 family)
VVNDLLTLPLAQRLELVQTLWDSIAADQIGPELSEDDRELIDQRLERFRADGDAGLDADEVLNTLEQLPGVNYVGGSRQLRRRVGAPNPLP